MLSLLEKKWGNEKENDLGLVVQEDCQATEERKGGAEERRGGMAKTTGRLVIKTRKMKMTVIFINASLPLMDLQTRAKSLD